MFFIIRFLRPQCSASTSTETNEPVRSVSDAEDHMIYAQSLMESNFSFEEYESESDVSNSDTPPVPKKKILTKIPTSVAATFPWVIGKNQTTYCQICNKSLKGGLSHVQRHAKSTYHIKREKAPSMPKLKNIFKPDGLKQNVAAAELKLVMFIAEHNISFKCGRSKGTQVLKKHLGPMNLRNICEILRKKSIL